MEKKYINHSGGALGSDMKWDTIGREYGFDQHKHWRPLDLTHLTEEMREEMLEAVKKAAIALGRPSVFPGVDLVRRNWLQVYNAEAIYAIGYIIDPGLKDHKGFVNKTGKQIVAGGTGWAVQMAIDMSKPVYVFDLTTERWYFMDSGGMTEFDGAPILTEKYAGIGTRNITEAGERAIRDVYEKTLLKDQQKQHIADVMQEDQKIGLYNTDKIPTAEEYIQKDGWSSKDHLDIKVMARKAIEFAKIHVEAALKAAAENAMAKENPSDYGTGEIWVDKRSILSAYPLENIK